MRLDVVEVGSSVHLVTSGPGGQRAMLEFSERHALIAYQLAYEARLRDEGYMLTGVIHERRRGGDRRRATRSDRRRQGGEGR